MGTCLKEIARDAVLICLFRSISNNEVSFHGMIRWQIAHKRIELTADLKYRGRVTYIYFSPEGTLETLNACGRSFTRFIADFGGIKQWKVDNNNKVHDILWNQAIELWGFPVWS
ncbi:hypothetical protein GGS26DRAFT_179041 [Hypomontagnella submonticulosa]|nr:hypothetical protein GGS26DRAFT_179041 [Hypomontagnella submonticulosa]